MTTKREALDLAQARADRELQPMRVFRDARDGTYSVRFVRDGFPAGFEDQGRGITAVATVEPKRPCIKDDPWNLPWTPLGGKATCYRPGCDCDHPKPKQRVPFTHPDPHDDNYTVVDWED